jgi:predicted DNA-binding transcriptional regulator AlpA
MMNANEENFDMKDLAKFIKVNRCTINRWKKNNPDFPRPFRVGRKLLWKKSEIEEYMESTRK